ncbi:MAG TPA: hypothetical protein PKE45_03480 [Caldilineaceae bacterium]|nr:hypothetical protein [Caldilineaceae bacterium]
MSILTSRTWVISLGLLMLVLTVHPTPVRATPGTNNTVYLPLTLDTGNQAIPSVTPTPLTPTPSATPTATPSETPTGANEGAVWLPYRLSETKVLPTYGASVAVDAAGGVHAAYGLLGAYDEADTGYSAYAYCAGQCANEGNWSFLHLGDGSEVRLQLDPAGHPRLLIAAPGATEGPNQHITYEYGLCDANCTDGANWQFTPIVETLDCIACVGERENKNNRYFALDPQGRPAFLAPRMDPASEFHSYLDYAVCLAADPVDCTQANNWTLGQIVDTNFPSQPSLVFAGVGKPRLALQVTNGLTSTLWYTECDQECTNAANWSWTNLTTTSYYFTMTFSLRVDSNGRPRIALYSGSYNEAPSPFDDNLLYYLSCDAQCATGDAANWRSLAIGAPTLSGHHVDLALDGQGRPRLAYSGGNDSLGYSWCDQNCETDNTAWQHRVAETKEALSDDYAILPIRRCTISAWLNGVRPSLALDPQGNPRIAYDAQHYWYGTETVGGEVRNCNFKDVNVTRLLAVNQPAGR